jgi:hypothetical protein
MTKLNIVIILTAALLTSTYVFGQRITTPMGLSSVNLACQQSGQSEYARGFCDGSIEAIYSSMDGWCVPDSVTHGQVQSLVKSGLARKLSNGGPLMRASDGVIEIIQEAWPCD